MFVPFITIFTENHYEKRLETYSRLATNNLEILPLGNGPATVLEIICRAMCYSIAISYNMTYVQLLVEHIQMSNEQNSIAPL